MDTAARNIMNDIWRLRRNSPVRRAAETIMADEKLPEELVVTLLTLVQDDSLWKRREHLVAAWSLGHLSLSESQRMYGIRGLSKIVLAKTGTRVRRTLKSLFRFGMIFGALSVFIVVFLSMQGVILSARSWLPDFIVESAGTVAIVTCTLIFAIGFVLLDIVDNNSIQAVALDSIKRLGGWESVRPLVAAALGADQALSRSAQLAVIQVLANLPIEERGRIEADTKLALVSLLDLSLGDARSRARFSLADDRLCLQILLLLRDIGSGESISAVEKISRSDTSPSRRQLASDMLPILRSRSQQEQNAAALLRIPESDSGNALLRPVTSSSTQSTDELLRAASSTSAEVNLSDH